MRFPSSTLGTPRSGRLLPMLAFAVATLSGCAGATVVEDTLSDDPVRLASDADNSAALKTVYTGDDRRITLSVRFASSVSYSERFMVEWFLPDGTVYLRRPVRARHEDGHSLATSMSIRGEAPSRLPGTWQVRLSLEGEELLARDFEILAAPKVPEGRVAAAFGPAVCRQMGWDGRARATRAERLPAGAAWLGPDALASGNDGYAGMLLLSTAADECLPGAMAGSASKQP